MLTEEEFEDYWNGWSEQELSNYKTIKNNSGKEARKYLKKGYLHFDNRFWFPERSEELKIILKNGLRFYNKNHKKHESWAFSPFLKILIQTPRYKYQQEEGHYDLETKIRPICFASHIDSLIYGFYSYFLTKKYESYIDKVGFGNCPLAYRSNLDGKCNIQFAKEVFDEIKHRGNCSAIALDIKGYFDHIDHEILKEKWIKVIGRKLPEDQFKLYKSLTEYSYVSKNSVLKKYQVDLKKLKKENKNFETFLELIPGNKNYHKFEQLRTDRLIVKNNKRNKASNRKVGIPQGSSMSALLSNIYLLDFDKDLYEKSIKEGFFYRRYCDDILIVCDSHIAERLQNEIIQKISDEYHLEIQNRKVEFTEFRPNSNGEIRAFNKKRQIKSGVTITNSANEKLFYKSLQYLGFEFNGQNIFIRSSSLSRYFRKMKSRIVKTVVMAYGRSGKDNKIWKQQIFERYSHLGKRNFITYAFNASNEYYINSNKKQKDGLNSPSIRKQLSRHFIVLQNTLRSKNDQRYEYKSSQGKMKSPKTI
ncbi:reverse transcriptase/maturase family protein [Sphingobacterium composti Ten et al. 2007 non Yoo et al. 2007]|uniref:reverse transcriptase/maturase family protein n=1 Tax=Sphingobacterium composti TaxID=363260 RepID=UPI00135B2E9C|nr:reverse transcriptase/maturase family protein [Sphingobacterium composti Ten et al. 2007 non Yoo et al. 2007]